MVQLNLNEVQNVQITLVNLLGEQVYYEVFREPIGKVNKQISLSLLPKGNYILQVIAENKLYHAKITKVE